MGAWDYILSEEPSLKDRVIAFFKGAPKRYSFAPEMDAAAKKWIQEYKKLFDQVAARNAGMNVVEDVTTVEKKEQIKKIGKLVDELGGTATQVPNKVIKKIGKLVPDENAESNKKTASGTKVQDSGERDAIDIFESMSEEYQDKGNEIADFIDGVNNMIDETKKSKRKKKIGVLSDSHVKIINNIVRELYPEFSAEGYELWIDGTGAQHIERRHGQNGEADSTMASREEKSLIPWAAQNAESGGFIRESDGSVRHSTRFFNKDGSRAPEIRLEKKTSDGVVFISECVPDSVNKRIWITSAYRNKKSSKGQLLNIEDTSSPQPTPEASFDSNATKTIIHKSDEKINTSDKKTSKNFDSGERFALSDKKADAKIEKQKIRLKAEYETDTVFSESGVKKRLATIDGYKALPASERGDIESRIWTELNESNGYDTREWLRLKWSVRLIDELVSQRGEAISRAERDIISKQVNQAIDGIVDSGRKSVRGRMEGEIRAELSDKIRNEATAKERIRSEIYQTLKKIEDKKTARKNVPLILSIFH